jgi:hypothetical protein
MLSPNVYKYKEKFYFGEALSIGKACDPITSQNTQMQPDGPQKLGTSRESLVYNAGVNKGKKNRNEN